MTADISDRQVVAFQRWVAARQETISDVARHAQVPRTTLYSWLSRKTKSLSGSVQGRIANAYGVDVTEIFGGRVARWVYVVAECGPDGVIYDLDGAGEKIKQPSWVPAADGYMICRIHHLESILPGTDLLAAFKARRSSPSSEIGQWVVAELTDGRRCFGRLAQSAVAGQYLLHRAGGSVAEVHVRATYSLVAMAPMREVGLDTGG